jgi:hypothetical protein
MDKPIEYGSPGIGQENAGDMPTDDSHDVLPEETYDDVPFQPAGMLVETPLSRYMRENRLLNSMLMALLFLILLFGILWNIIIYAPSAGEAGPDFTDAALNMEQSRPKKPDVRLKQRLKKPSPPAATSVVRPIAISDIVIPNISLNVSNLEPTVDVGVSMNVGDVGTNVDLSALNKAFTSSFMGVKSEASKICFIIDYSASMRGRDRVMRDELVTALNKLPPTGEVCVIFFSGPTWLAGEDASALHKNWQGTNGGGWSPKPGFKPSRPKWIPVTPSSKKKLAEAVRSTPLTFGTVWNNSFEWAFYLNPKPDVIYFMTDGSSSPATRGMDLIKTKKGRTKIYTIGYAAPKNAKAPLEEIAAMTGGSSKFVSMEQIQVMEKKIQGKNPAGKKPPKKKK